MPPLIFHISTCALIAGTGYLVSLEKFQAAGWMFLGAALGLLGGIVAEKGKS